MCGLLILIREILCWQVNLSKRVMALEQLCCKKKKVAIFNFEK